MKLKNYRWLGYLLPQTTILPLVYLGTLEEEKAIALEFWIAPIMLYVLFVCFSNIVSSKTKTEYEKVKRNVMSGFITYVILTVYVGMNLLKHPTFSEQTILVALFIVLQLIQYGVIGWRVRSWIKSI